MTESLVPARPMIAQAATTTVARSAGRAAPRRTRILKSYYCGLDSWSSPFNYRLLRAGHIATGPDYRIERDSVPGHEFLFCLAGAGYVRIASTSHRVEKGRLVWLPVQRPHAHYPDPDMPWEILWLRLEGSNLNRLQAVLGVDAEPIFGFADEGAIRRLLEDALAQMHEHSMLAAAASERIAAALVEKLMESRSTRVLDPVVTGHRGLARLLQEVRAHYDEPWTTDRFAETCRVSTSHLFRLFKYAFGQTPQNWLRGYRLAEAKRLLVETDETIGGVARTVGYDDPLHFSRDFRKNVGLSPRRFRALER